MLTETLVKERLLRSGETPRKDSVVNKSRSSLIDGFLKIPRKKLMIYCPVELTGGNQSQVRRL